MNEYEKPVQIQKRTARIALLALGFMLIGFGIAGCHSENDAQDLDFTGEFQATIPFSYKTSQTHSFVLTQDEDVIWGTYTKSGYTIGMPYSSLYDLTGNVPIPGAAVLQLTLKEFSPPETSTPPLEITLNVVLNEHGDVLRVNEWDLDVPRIEHS